MKKIWKFCLWKSCTAAAVFAVIALNLATPNLAAKDIANLPNGKFLLNDYYAPNRLVFRLKKGSFECSILGVVVPFYGGQNRCNSAAFVRMSHLAIGFFQNHLNLEQLYGVGFEDGYCVLHFGGIDFGEFLVKKGYGVVNRGGVKDGQYLEELLRLQDIAKSRRIGLWRDFYDEMECLGASY